MRSPERGAMLVDVMIGVTIVVVIMAVAYPGFKVANDAMSTNGQKVLIERAADRTLSRLEEVFRSGRVVSIADAGSPPEFQLQSLQGNLDIGDLGGSDPEIWQATNRVVRFVPIRTISESQLNEDVNLDGDRKDSFSLGSVELVTGSTVERLSGNASVLLGLPSYRGDLDGDGEFDPLIERNGRELNIRLTVASQADRGRLLKTTVVGRLRLRNPQD